MLLRAAKQALKYHVGSLALGRLLHVNVLLEMGHTLEHVHMLFLQLLRNLVVLAQFLNFPNP